MFFLFATALFALPLAGLPVLLHMLFRKKSPVVPFSTLRFVQASIQKTAARKRLQRWLLLTARVLLIGLVIAAAAQPVRKLAGAFGGSSTAVAVVLDTSYSMRYQRADRGTLLDAANRAVGDLLGTELRDAQVAVFRSQPDAAAERFRPGSEWAGAWTDAAPQAAPVPLADRIAAASERLAAESSAQKWLFVVSDLQSHELPRELPLRESVRVAVANVQPVAARSAGVTAVRLIPPQPVPGVPCEVAVDLVGRAGESRAVTLKVENVTAAGTAPVSETPPQMARFDAAGRAAVRFVATPPAQPQVLFTAQLAGQDDMPWDDARSLLLRLPTRTPVRLVDADAPAGRFVRLALDPTEGNSNNWPLQLLPAGDAKTAASTWVQLVSGWPDDRAIGEWESFARNGGTLLLMLQPGVEQAWPTLPEARRKRLAALLPAQPSETAAPDRVYRLTGSTEAPAVLGDLLDAKFQPQSVTVQRFVTLSPAAGSTTMLSVEPAVPWPGARAVSLLVSRPVGAGQVLLLATQPELRYTNLATHPLFLPMLVRLAMRPVNATAANVEVGQPVALPGPAATGASALTVQSPSGQKTVVQAGAGGGFEFKATDEPGVYRWLDAAGNVVGASNVSLPALESQLTYRSPTDVVKPPDDPNAPQPIVASSVEELRAAIGTATEPQPRWAWAVASVLVLLCFESLLGARR